MTMGVTSVRPPTPAALKVVAAALSPATQAAVSRITMGTAGNITVQLLNAASGPAVLADLKSVMVQFYGGYAALRCEAVTPLRGQGPAGLGASVPTTWLQAIGVIR